MGDLQDRYRFLSVVGEGGFGRVYRARLEATEGFHKDVAIKVLQDPNPSARLLMLFKDEARILGMVRDRAVVNVEPPVKIGDKWALVMEFVEGVSCGELLQRLGAMPPGVAAEIVAEVARALHNVYNMEGSDGKPIHLLHRDIKPDNIQITPSGEVKILDFGIARADIAHREFKTRQSIGGTPGYIAPERMHGIEGPAGDVFSLGVVMYELVTSRRPAYAETTAAPPMPEDAEVRETLAEIPVTTDPMVREVLELSKRMRAPDPEHRPTARDVERECRRIRRACEQIYLRDWAEESVRPHTEAPDDELVGQVVQAHTADLDTRPPSLDGGLDPGGFRRPNSGNQGINTPVAAAAALGILGVAAAAGVAALVATVVLFAVIRPGGGPGVDGPGVDGVASDGVASDGVASDGVATDGVATDGVASDGVATDGVATDGVATDGVTPPAPNVAPAPDPEGEEPGRAVPEPPAPDPVEPAPVRPKETPRGKKPAPAAAPEVVVEPAPAPAPAPEPVVSTGTVRVTGDVGDVWLVRDGARVGMGSAVPAGTYAVWAVFTRTGETKTEATVVVQPGQTYVVTCKDAFASCKVAH